MMKVVLKDIFYEAKNAKSTIQSVSDINSNKGPIGNLLHNIMDNQPVERQ
jgi:hypothetical protein